MEVIKTIAELRRRLASEPRVACVPTMGNIHDGHLRLVGIAHEHAPLVVTTIFVNRMQFTGGEDFERYPRTFAEDCEKLAAQGVHIVFHPDDTQMYPQAQTFVVEPPPIANKLEGRFRPGHFRGMATVVLKLFNIVQPQVAVFGKKDYQQLHIVQHMVEQLALPVRDRGSRNATRRRRTCIELPQSLFKRGRSDARRRGCIRCSIRSRAWWSRAIATSKPWSSRPMPSLHDMAGGWIMSSYGDAPP